jgi:hypothetical protein
VSLLHRDARVRVRGDATITRWGFDAAKFVMLRGRTGLGALWIISITGMVVVSGSLLLLESQISGVS